MSMSLDGYVTGPRDNRERPLGEGGEVHGATAAQQALAAGLPDEIQVHLEPVLLGGGVRLFDLLGADQIRWSATESSRLAAASLICDSASSGNRQARIGDFPPGETR